MEADNIDDVDIEKLIADIPWTGYVSWKNVRSALYKQKLRKVDPKKIKDILVALGFAEVRGIMTAWTDKGIEFRKLAKK